MLPGEPEPCSRSRKDVLKKQTQIDALNQPKKKVRMNEAVADINNLEIDSLKVI